MTDARDELAALIRDTVHSGTGRVSWEDIADAILAAGMWLPHIPESQIIHLELDDE